MFLFNDFTPIRVQTNSDRVIFNFRDLLDSPILFE